MRASAKVKTASLPNLCDQHRVNGLQFGQTRLVEGFEGVLLFSNVEQFRACSEKVRL